MGGTLLWIGLTDLCRGWLRALLGMVVIALGVVGVAYFAGQAGRSQAAVRASYEQEGAGSFVIELSNVPDTAVEQLVGALRKLDDVREAAAPYNGVELGVLADTYFLVFENTQQKEYLGARLGVLGVGPDFDPRAGYFVDFHRINPQAPRSALGIPLLPVSGELRPPGPNEILIPTTVADYVGITPGSRASVELVYTDLQPPIVRRLDGLELIGVFDAVGPDSGRIDPFWRLEFQGQPVLTVRGSGGEEVTTLPVVLNAGVVRDFLSMVSGELRKRHLTDTLPLRAQIVVSAASLTETGSVENEAVALLKARGLTDENIAQATGSTYRILLPERNNFLAARHEEAKLGAGAAFFTSLLLILIAMGAAGLQAQAAVARWRDYGVLQALGFAPGKIVVIYGSEIVVILAGAIGLAAIAALVAPTFLWFHSAFVKAAGLTAAATLLGGLPALLWPLHTRPAGMLKELQ